jgi:hypothetical protein
MFARAAGDAQTSRQLESAHKVEIVITSKTRVFG